ncbi:flavodoxin FldA [Parabacteroides sp. Marseille-P3160]|uniref:flavodoxin FldA n=1 Tax=Parabacteroides sp. Marseille-P3160 TaxID=1917887 RepID=UPI0009BC55BA|nr:flavodoxin FldA [Parabacteroides sp. Marseille-P3160]
MGKIGIFYGSSTGNTEEAAKLIGEKLGVPSEDIHDIYKLKASPADYDVLLLGSSSTGSGDLQDDWETFLETLKETDLKGKKIALFGLGDSSTFSDTFLGATGKIYDALKDSGATFIGTGVSTDGYTFDESEAVVDGAFVGLPLDADNESDLTEGRIDAWVEKLKSEL